MHDLLIRNAHIVDGTGAKPFDGDVAISNGCIAAIGKSAVGAARETINADGRLVAPGFVDIHTHYDGQVTWDTDMKPSSDHGVTTVVMGNCGVGFAPVRPGSEKWLIELMEGVEDIPGSALTEGMTWGWESFPRVPGRSREAKAGNRCRGASPSWRAPRLRDGRARGEQRAGNIGRDCDDGATRPRSARGGSNRVLIVAHKRAPGSRWSSCPRHACARGRAARYSPRDAQGRKGNFRGNPVGHDRKYNGRRTRSFYAAAGDAMDAPVCDRIGPAGDIHADPGT